MTRSARSSDVDDLGDASCRPGRGRGSRRGRRRRSSGPACPASTAAWPRAMSRWLLPVPAGPTRQRFSAARIHSSEREVVEGGLGDRGQRDVELVQGLGDGEAGGRAAGCGRWTRPGPRSRLRPACAAPLLAPSVASWRCAAPRGRWPGPWPASGVSARRPDRARSAGAGGGHPSSSRR